MLISRLREIGVVGTARFVGQLARVTFRSPSEGLDHLKTQVDLTRAGAPAVPIAGDEDWRSTLHQVVGRPWPCPVQDEFRRLWAELMAQLDEDATLGTGHDADPTLTEAAWCIVRHTRPDVVVETGVSRGVTSRVILEALARNGSGQLWSVDLPPLEEPWRRLAGSAVPARLRDRWTYVRGASRRRLPPLIRELGSIDLFLHDSLHTESNLRFELEHAWPALRPGGIALIDDAQACRAFERIIPELRASRSFAARHRSKDDAIGIVAKGPSG